MEGDLPPVLQAADVHGISIHTLRMEGDPLAGRTITHKRPISIHTLRMEGDEALDMKRNRKLEFQSTPSAWRVTGWSVHYANNHSISIHTLRMEGDLVPRLPALIRTLYFNPHPPHGG